MQKNKTIIDVIAVKKRLLIIVKEFWLMIQLVVSVIKISAGTNSVSKYDYSSIRNAIKEIKA